MRNSLALIFALSQDWASAAGLVAKEVDLDIALPPSLFTKPLVCVQDFLQRVAAYHVQGAWMKKF
jgi:hypothetical protein